MKHCIAIIGYGGMGDWHHKSIMEKVPSITVKGAFDIREEARAKAAENGLLAYGTLEELLADPEIDLVTVATPNNYHKELVIRCLEAGKNVICEKPVAMNAGELEEMMAAALRVGKVFSIHQNRRWDKDYVIIKKLLADGTIDKPYFIESRVQGSRGAMFGWRSYKMNGGGMALDWGVHLIDQMLDLIPEKVVTVYANLFSIFSGEVDDNIKIMLRFENGISALLEMSTNCFVTLPRWHISGTGGTAVIEDWSCEGRIVKLNTESEMEWDDVIVYTEAGPTRTMAPRPVQTTQQLDLPQVTTDWSDYYNNIAEVLDGKTELIVKPEQALRVMKVIDLVFESERTKTGISCCV